MTTSSSNRKAHNSSISLQKAKSNGSLINRTIKVSLSNPKYSIEKNTNELPTTKEMLFENLNSKKSLKKKNIIPTISIDNTMKNNIHKLYKKKH